MAEFVNPYTFVPWPSSKSGPAPQLDRRAPAGHAKPVRDGWHGELEWEFEARSPLLVRWPGTAPDQHAAPMRRTGGQDEYIVPGSSLHGALRSLHEIIAGGCLRVFDDEFVPSYRDEMPRQNDDSAKPAVDDWRLARVLTVDDNGRPTSLGLTEQFRFQPPGKHDVKHTYALWIAVGPGALPDNLTTGDRLHLPSLPESIASENRFRAELSTMSDATVDPNGPWIVLFSDPKARQTDGYFVALGRLGTTEVPMTDEAWFEYRTAAAGSRDYQELNQAYKKRDPGRRGDVQFRQTSGPEVLQVNWPDEDNRKVLRGSRHGVFPFVHPNQVLWVRVRDNQAIAAKASQLWRHTAGQLHGERRDAGGRVRAGWDACREDDRLCPSCRVFGSADTLGREEDEQGAQFSYRGHVRVLDAHPVGAVTTRAVELAPMGQPRPGAGQFYLAAPQQDSTASSTLPDREWGAGPDEKHLRLLRGRKMYWRTNDVPGRHRFQRRTHHERLFTKVEYFAEGSRFRARLVFENLTEAEVGGLIATIDPGRLLRLAVDGDVTLAQHTARYAHDPNGEFVVPVGGGKPFGFGSCATRQVTVRRVDPGARYRGESPVDTTISGDDLDALVTAFITDRSAVSDWLPGKNGQWAQVAHTLRMNHVDGSIVWYPPGGQWTELDAAARATGERRQKLEEHFDTPFEFWKVSKGWDGEPLIPLPVPAAPKQTLHITEARMRRDNR